jgi:hypothetical protein
MMLFKLAMVGVLVAFSAIPVTAIMMSTGMTWTEAKPIGDMLFGGGSLFALIMGGLSVLFDI